MNFEEAVEKFVESPCRLTTGVPSLSKRWNIDLDTLYAAKASAKDILKNKEQFGTEYNPKDVAFISRDKGSDINIQEELVDITKEDLSYQMVLLGTKDLYSHLKEFAPNIKVESPTDNQKEELREINARLLKKWGSEGNWKYSYDYSQDTASQINFEEILNKVFNSDEKVAEMVCKDAVSSSNSLNIYLTDQHIGMKVEHSLYSNYFDKHVYRDRMNKVFVEIAKLNQLYNFETINIFFLGDTFDGQDGFTVKRTHELPQNMSNEEAFEVGLYTNKIFLEKLFESKLAKTYGVYFVRESNHGGDMDLYLFKSLRMWINTCYGLGFVTVKIAHRFIDHVVFGNHTFIYTHGKDNKDMKNGLPITLDAKTENFINQYIYENNIKGYIHFVKGDLHQDALNNGKLFDYRNVPALSGSSKWVMSNYGLTEPGVGYDIFCDGKKTPTRNVIEF